MLEAKTSDDLKGRGSCTFCVIVSALPKYRNCRFHCPFALAFRLLPVELLEGPRLGPNWKLDLVTYKLP